MKERIIAQSEYREKVLVILIISLKMYTQSLVSILSPAFMLILSMLLWLLMFLFGGEVWVWTMIQRVVTI